MNWQETVMSDVKLNNVMVNFPARPDTDWLQIIRHIAKAQAEISFKAGIREVVEWVEEHGLYAGWVTVAFTKNEWQAFKKERGIDG